MSALKKVVIIAGEESGDYYAANIIKQLLQHYPAIEISGIGGHHMQQAGAKLVSNLASYGVTGLSEVLRHFWVIKKSFTAIKNHLRTTKPNLLILIDYPGFNLRLAKFAKQTLMLPIIYYISPQIWAWKANRINIIKAYIDHMAVILPFEKAIYSQAGINVSFVGHPLIDKIPNYNDEQQLRQQLQLPLNKKIVAFLPGSRRNEIVKLMPVLAATAKRLNAKFDNLHFVIPIADSLEPQLVKNYFCNAGIAVTFFAGRALEVMYSSDCVVVASGTASLECALLVKPMCIIYKASLLTYAAAMQLVKVKYLGLCNLLANKMIVPELLQNDCNAAELSHVVDNLLHNESLKKTMINNLQQLKTNLSNQHADQSVYQLIEAELKH